MYINIYKWLYIQKLQQKPAQKLHQLIYYLILFRLKFFFWYCLSSFCFLLVLEYLLYLLENFAFIMFKNGRKWKGTWWDTMKYRWDVEWKKKTNCSLKQTLMNVNETEFYALICWWCFLCVCCDVIFYGMESFWVTFYLVKYILKYSI